ncbi:MAG: hypothetical protein JWR80_6532 [Bradyrhizobium sp.]|nr:hypothetical protein [Bradyrhizobium sp.]
MPLDGSRRYPAGLVAGMGLQKNRYPDPSLRKNN